MSPLSQLEAEPDEDRAVKRSLGRSVCAAAGWALATAVAAGGSWAVGLAVVRYATGVTLLAGIRNAPLFEVTVFPIVICAGWGLLVGTMFVLIRSGIRRLGSAILSGLALALAGFAAGVLTLIFTLAVPLWPEVSSSLAWSAVGLYVGLVGYSCRRKPSPVTVPERTGESPPWSVRAAAGWGVAGALSAGGTWAFWIAVWQYDLLEAVAGELPVMTVLAGGIGLVWGFVVGLLIGLRHIRSGTTFIMCAFGGALFGGVSAVATPLVVTATRGLLPVWLSSTLAWTLVGFVTGVIAYLQNRRHAKPDDVLEDMDELPRRAGPRVLVAWGGRVSGPVIRLLPIVAVSAACLVAVVVGEPSPAGWALLAAGLLGLAVARALRSQEQRIRELERRLAERDEGRS